MTDYNIPNIDFGTEESYSEYLLSAYFVPGTIINSEHSVITKTDTVLYESCRLVEKHERKY